jgi:hypothetical protein
MSCTTFICGTIKQKLATLEALHANENQLARTAVKHGIPLVWAREYIRREIEAKRAGL